jgi:hypothetical protein
MSSVKITVDDYRGKGRCASESVEGNKCRRLARCSVTIESVTSDGTIVGPSTSALCWDCEDRTIANYTREFRSELGRCYFGSLSINGNEIKR